MPFFPKSGSYVDPERSKPSDHKINNDSEDQKASIPGKTQTGTQVSATDPAQTSQSSPNAVTPLAATAEARVVTTLETPKNNEDFNKWLQNKKDILTKSIELPENSKSFKQSICKVLGTAGPILGGLFTVSFLIVTIVATVFAALGSSALFGVPIVAVLVFAAIGTVVSAIATAGVTTAGSTKYAGDKMVNDPAPNIKQIQDVIIIAMLDTITGVKPSTQDIDYSQLCKNIEKTLANKETRDLMDNFFNHISNFTSGTDDYDSDLLKNIVWI